MYLSIHLSICKKTYVRVTYTNPEPYRNIASDFKVLIQALPIASQALSEDGSGVLEGQADGAEGPSFLRLSFWQ